MASPKCQYILNEVIYFEWPHWQTMSRLPKIAWSFIQLAFVTLSSPVYIPLRLARRSSRCDKGARNLWWFREMYEHPFSKFINHTTWYLVFLAFAFSSSFEQEFGTTVTGLLSIGKSNADHIHHQYHHHHYHHKSSSSLMSSS